MKYIYLIAIVLLIVSCGNRRNTTNEISLNIPKPLELPKIIDSDSILGDIYMGLSELSDELFSFAGSEINDANIDWAQFISVFQQVKYSGKRIFVNIPPKNKFEITQSPRLDDIGYIDTMLCVAYLYSGMYDGLFERELQKYLSLPITFYNTLPLFENSQANESGQGSIIGDFSSNGIFVNKTADKKYKIYSYDDLTGGTGRCYRTYLQYVKNGSVSWSKELSRDRQIRDVHSINIKQRTYYVLKSFFRTYSPEWYEFIEIITIKDGVPTYHMNFFPNEIQERLYSAFDRNEFKREYRLRDPDATDELLEEFIDEWMPEYEKWMGIHTDITGIEFWNGARFLDIDVDFDPKTLTVSYNDIVPYGGDGERISTGERKHFKLKIR